MNQNCVKQLDDRSREVPAAKRRVAHCSKAHRVLCPRSVRFSSSELLEKLEAETMQLDEVNL